MSEILFFYKHQIDTCLIWLNKKHHCRLMSSHRYSEIVFFRTYVQKHWIGIYIFSNNYFLIFDVTVNFSFRMGLKTGRSNWCQCLGRQLGRWCHRGWLFNSAKVRIRKPRNENGKLDTYLWGNSLWKHE